MKTRKDGMTPEEICLKENRVMFGKYFCEDGVPCIELIVPKTKYDVESDTESVTGTKMVYLSAFRRYCFQVSQTRSGEWNLGSTPVFGLETFTSITQIGSSNLGQESTVKYIISCVAMDAIRDYCSHNYGCGLTMPTVYFSGALSDPDWEKFIEETLKFCRHEVVEKTVETKEV